MLKKIKEDGESGLRVVKTGIQNLFLRSVEEVDSLKLRMNIRKIERELDDLYLKAGKILYDKFHKGESGIEDSELSLLFSKTAQLKEARQNLKADLADRINQEMRGGARS